jgi:hypothetical protein
MPEHEAMAQSKAAWDQVGDRFNELSQRVKAEFDARVAFTEEDRAKVESALRTLGDALESAFNTFGDALRNESLRAQLKDAARAMGDALSTSFREASAEVKKRVGRDGD